MEILKLFYAIYYIIFRIKESSNDKLKTDTITLSIEHKNLHNFSQSKNK